MRIVIGTVDLDRDDSTAFLPEKGIECFCENRFHPGGLLSQRCVGSNRSVKIDLFVYDIKITVQASIHAGYAEGKIGQGSDRVAKHHVAAQPRRYVRWSLFRRRGVVRARFLLSLRGGAESIHPFLGSRLFHVAIGDIEISVKSEFLQEGLAG